MTGTGYRELEKRLERALKAFSKTKQKLNLFERRRRDRIAALLGEIVRKRTQREKAKAALISPSAR